MNCFRKALNRTGYPEIEELRKGAKRSSTLVRAGILGASMKQEMPQVEKVKEIAKKGITSLKYSLLLQEITRYFNCRNVIEFGTSIGINTLYLAKSSDICKVYSFEGNPELCKIARENFRRIKTDNIELIEGNIDEVLPAFIQKNIKPDFVFFDANHKYEPTIRYYDLLNTWENDSVFVFDDIHWSKEMEHAWNHIRSGSEVRVDIDLYQVGIIFFRKNLHKMSYRFRF